MLQVEQDSKGTAGDPGALKELELENARLKAETVALKKKVEDLTQQMFHDQRAANERIDKLLFML